MITLNNLVLIGQAVPEQGRDAAAPELCSIGYDRDLRQWVRIHPMPSRSNPDWRRWTTWSVDLERRSSDTRHESFAPLTVRPVAVDKESRDRMRQTLATELSQSSALSVDWLNDERRSIGLCRSIVPPAVEVERVAPNKGEGVHARQFRPFLHWRDETGDDHRQTLLDWGTFMRIDQLIQDGTDNPRDVARDLTKALYLDREGREFYVLCGNQSNRRTSYLAISVFGWDPAITSPSWRKAGGAARLVDDRPRLFLRSA